MRKRALRYVLCIWIGFWTFSQTTTAQNAILDNPSACGLNLPLADNSCPDDNVFFNPDEFVIRVENAPGDTLGQGVYLREVRLILLHPWTSDLDIALISPGGQSVLLTADNGGGEDDYGAYTNGNCGIPVTFSVEACKPIQEGEAPFTDGPFLPEESLYLFNDGQTNPNGDWLLQVCDDVSEDVGVLQYVELVFAPLQCLPITDFRIVDIDSTTFALDWTPGPSCQTAVIEYGPPGFQPGDGRLANEGDRRVVTGCPPYLLTGLDPGVEYEVYIRQFCGSKSTYSANSCPVIGTSGCRPPPITLLDDFDDESLCQASCGATCDLRGRWKNRPDQSFNWLVREGPTPTPETGPDTDASGDGRYLYLETSGQACNDEQSAQLYSHCIQLDKMNADTCHLSFNYHMYGSSVGRLRLEASSDGGENWQTLWSKEGNQGDRWHKVYLSLDRYADGSILQFRFTGTGSSEAKGDMALDNIVFYGSVDLGDSPFIYYADEDGDGFGDPAIEIRSCLGATPAGFVENGLDCNDDNPNIHPDAQEVPCNQIDENCNGADDDLQLPPPRVTNDTICSGELAMVRADSDFDKPIFWYGSPTGNDFVAFGNAYFVQLPENDGPLPVTYRFYAEETDFACVSESRAEALIVVNPRPKPLVGAIPDICPGEMLDLTSIGITDENFTGATLRFHTQPVLSPENELNNTIIQSRRDTTFYFTQTTPRGCAVSGQIDVRVKPSPRIDLLPAAELDVCREDTTTVTAIAQGGAGGYAYFWSNGVFGAELPVRGARLAGDRQSYHLTVTDTEGCSTIDSLIIHTTTSIDSIRRIVRNVSACSDADGAITIVPLDGVPPFHYRWLGSDGSNGERSNVTDTLVLDNLAQGSYQLTITDSSQEQCSFVTRQILVNGPAAIVESVDVRDVSCFRAQDGRICVEVLGGAPAFLWNTGATTPCIDGLSGGIYAVTLTEGDCETVIEGIEVREPELLRVVASFDRPTCFDSADGAIALSTFGGTAPYQYQWGTGDSQRDLEGLNAGTYSLTVTDANRCLLLTSVELSGPSEIRIETDSIRPISCPGANDGYIKVSASGGTAPYHYAWDTGRTSPLLPQAGPGTHTLSVTDFNGCVKTMTYVFEDPTPVSARLEAAEPPKCLGDNTGRIVVNAEGGAPPYRYFWSNGARGPVAENLEVGRYTVTVTDANNCAADTLAVNLPAQSPLSVRASIVAPVCAGAANGAILLTPEGTAPFSFSWASAPNLDNALLENIGEGAYPVRITDAEGCRLDTIIEVSASQVFQPQINTVAPRCAGSADGVIDVSFVSAGIPPFEYTWNNDSRTDRLIGVEAGAYQFTVTDIRGCTYTSDTILLEAPAPIGGEVLGQGPIICQGERTGFLEMEIRGGVPPYTYNWVGQGVQTKDIFNIPAGNYRLQVADANDCPYDTTITLNEPASLQADIEVAFDQSCNATYVRQLTAQATGGAPPYRYRWNNGAEDQQLLNPPSGDYQLSVADANGCIAETPAIKVAQREVPIRLDSFFVTDVTCRGDNNGTMNARISGGQAPYRFHFSNNEIIVTSNTNVRIENLATDDDYMVTVTDLTSGCVVVSERKSISEPPQLSFRRDSLKNAPCFGDQSGAIYTTAAGGVPPYEVQWFSADGRIAGMEEDLTNVGAGRYTGVLVDANGCTDTLRVEIRNLNTELRRPAEQIFIHPVACKGETDGAIDITLTGGRPPYDYQWSNGADTEDLNNLPAGTYTLTVVDGAGCQTVFPPLAVAEPAQALRIAGAIRNVRCRGFDDGRIDLSISGGTPPYQVEWMHNDELLGGDQASLDSLRAGSYFVKVTDQNGCQESAAFGVAEPPRLDVQLSQTDTSLTAEPAGGIAPYGYLWNTGDTGREILFPPPGEYAVTVTDQNGCRASADILIVDIYDPAWVETVRLYPNPAAERAQLDISLRAPSPLRLELYGPLGRLLRRQEREAAARHSFALPLDVSPAGLYIVKLYTPAGLVFTGKLIRQ